MIDHVFMNINIMICRSHKFADYDEDTCLKVGTIFSNLFFYKIHLLEYRVFNAIHKTVRFIFNLIRYTNRAESVIVSTSFNPYSL